MADSLYKTFLKGDVFVLPAIEFFSSGDSITFISDEEMPSDLRNYIKSYYARKQVLAKFIVSDLSEAPAVLFCGEHILADRWPTVEEINTEESWIYVDNLSSFPFDQVPKLKNLKKILVDKGSMDKDQIELLKALFQSAEVEEIDPTGPLPFNTSIIRKEIVF